jgi:hypothetical protein
MVGQEILFQPEMTCHLHVNGDEGVGGPEA